MNNESITPSKIINETYPVPHEWEQVRVCDVFEFSKKPRSLKIPEDELVTFIPMDHIHEANANVDWQVKPFSQISSGTFVFKDDLIVAKITPCFENGKQALLKNIPNNYAYATTEVWALHPKGMNVLTPFLYHYLKLPDIRTELAAKMEGSTGRQRLPRHVLENLVFPLPSIEEQQQIITVLSTIYETKIRAEAKSNALNELFKSMLNELMTGKIRVNDVEFEDG